MNICTDDDEEDDIRQPERCPTTEEVFTERKTEFDLVHCSDASQLFISVPDRAFFSLPRISFHGFDS